MATVLVLGTALGACAYKTVRQQEIWRDNGTFWAYVFETSPAVGYDAIARDRLQRQDWQAAIEPLQRVVSLRPGDAYAVSALGECFYRTGRQLKGSELIAEAVVMDPSNLTARERVYTVLEEGQDTYRLRATIAAGGYIPNSGVSWGILSLTRKPPDP